MSYLVTEVKVDVSTKRLIGADNLPQALENILRVFYSERMIVGASFVDKDGNAITDWDVDDTFELSVDSNFTHTDTDGTLNQAYSGAVTTIVVDYTVDPGDLDDAGQLLLRNDSNLRETINYTAVSGTSLQRTFTVSKTLTYSYASGDFCGITDELMVRVDNDDVDVAGDWDDVDRANAKLSFRLDCNRHSFLEKTAILNNDNEIPVNIEIKRYPVGESFPSIILQDVIYARRTVRDVEEAGNIQGPDWTQPDSRYQKQHVLLDEIGEDLQDADTIDLYNDSTATHEKALMTRFTTYIQAALSLAYQALFTDLTEIGRDWVDGDFLDMWDTGGAAQKKSLVSRSWTYISDKLSALTAKATPVSADSLLLTDSEASDALKRSTISALAAMLPYDNTISEIEATTIKGALDELDLITATRNSTGLRYGAEVTINVDTTKIDIAVGCGDFPDAFTDEENPTYTTHTWTAITAYSPPLIATENNSFISVDSTGTPQNTANYPTAEQRRDWIVLAAIAHEDKVNVRIVLNAPVMNRDVPARELDMALSFGGLLNVSGNKYSANGANLNIDKEVGITYGPGINYQANQKDPNNAPNPPQTALEFVRIWHGSGAVAETELSSDIDATQYDPNKDGTRVNITTGFFVAHRIFFDGASNTTLVQYGQFEYDSLKKAVDSAVREDYGDVAETGTIYLKSIIVVQQGTTELNDDEKAKFIHLGVIGGKTLMPTPSYSSFAESIEIVDALSYERPEVTLAHNSVDEIYADVQQVGGGDMKFIFNQQEYTLDCTTGGGVGGKARVTLTPGTEATPVSNWVYVIRSGGVAVLNTSTSRPTGEFSFVGEFVLPDVTSFIADGKPYSAQEYWDAKSFNGRGTAQRTNEWIRTRPPQYESGIAQTVTITPQGASPDNVDFDNASGTAWQKHLQNFPALTISVDGIRVANDSVSAYDKITDLNLLLTDANGMSMSGTRFNLVIWGCISKTTGECQLFCNLPTGTYGSDSQCIEDPSNHSVTSIPAKFRSTGFLIARMPLKHTTTQGGTWVNLADTELGLQVIDLRGALAGNISGSASIPAATEFPTDTHRLFDPTASGKQLAHDLSSWAGAVTRTITVPDSDVTLLKGVPVLTTQYRLVYVNAAGEVVESATIITDSTGNLRALQNLYAGTHDGQNEYFFERYSSGAPYAYIISGKSDNNVSQGIILACRNGNGQTYNAIQLDGRAGPSQNTVIKITDTDEVLINTPTPYTSEVFGVNGAAYINGHIDAQSLKFFTTSELTITTGSITATQAMHGIDTESDASSDELNTIVASSYSGLLFVRAEHTDRTVVLKDGTGNLELGGGDITLDDTNKFVLLAYDTTLTKWLIVGGGGGAATNHNDLSGLQGGQSAQYYHLTAAEHAALGSGGGQQLFPDLSEIAADIVDADYIDVWDTSLGAQVKALWSRAWTYISGKILAVPNKATPIDADWFLIKDSVAGTLKNVTLANLKTALGSLLGALGSTDNVLVRSDGTGGQTAQGSGVLLDDSDNLTIPSGSDIKTNTVSETTATNGVTVDQLKIKDGGLIDLLNIDWPTITELTISGDAIVPTRIIHRIDTESDAASDNLSTITHTAGIDLLYLRAENSGRTVTLKDGVGNLELGGSDIILDDTNKFVVLAYDATLIKWLVAGGAQGQQSFPDLTEIGEDLADGDYIDIWDISGPSQKKALMSRVWTYISGKLSALATKTVPVDADAVLITDSAASDAPKRVLFSNLEAAIEHGKLADLEGGGAGEYNHVTDAQLTAIDAAISGALGSTDNVIMRADGTGGQTAQGSGIAVDDTDNMTVPAVGSVLTDTISETSAGNGVDIDSLKLKDQGITNLKALGTSDGTLLTIASGVITPTQLVHRVLTQASAAEDDLDTITHTAGIDVIIIRAQGSGTTVILKHATGNIWCGGSDVDLDDNTFGAMLYWSAFASKWILIDPSINLAGGGAHNDLSGLQGGQSAQYYHLTQTQHDSNVIGDVGSTDNRLVRSNGTGGQDVQGSNVELQDTGTINLPTAASLGTNTIDEITADNGVVVDGLKVKDQGLVDLLNIDLNLSTELTISGGAITPTQIIHSVDTESDAGTDDLATVTHTTGIDIVFLRAQADSRDVVLKHGTGNLRLGGEDITLDAIDQFVMLVWNNNSTYWIAVCDPRGPDPSTDIDGLTETTDINQDDEFIIYDVSAAANRKITAGNIRQTIINLQTGTSYTGVLADAGKDVHMSNAAANTFTLPLYSSVAYPGSTTMCVVMRGAGTTTIASASGGTLNGVTNGSCDIQAQYTRVFLTMLGSDTWMIEGNHDTVA